MRKVRSGACLAIVLIGLCMISLAGFGEITLHKLDGGAAQANWWYCRDHAEVCPTNPGNPCPTDHCTVADHWSVELGTHSAEDWAMMRMECAQEGPRLFAVGDIGDATFVYKMLDSIQAPVQTDSGPSMAFHLYDGTDDFLLISEPAAVQTAACLVFDPINAMDDWWFGEWDGSEIDSFDVTTAVRYSDWALVVAGSPQTASLAAYDVHAIMAVMGEVGDKTRAPQIFTGMTLIDDVRLEWNTGIAYGGLYHVEPPWVADATTTPPWPNVYNFDDSAQIPVPGPNDQPLQEDYWCKCDHCMPEDDINLWRIAYEGDVPNLVGKNGDMDVTPFPSSGHALYFGNNSWNYEAGEVAVGMICSPYNELNPGDRFVSISFDYFREVEYYLDGDYDWTYVQVWFDDWGIPVGQFDPWSDNHNGDTSTRPVPGGGLIPLAGCAEPDWKTIWYRDSSDPSVKTMQSATITHYLDGQYEPLVHSDYRIQIPPQATRMKIRFGFNSRDGASNDYFGWLVDNIVKIHSPDPVGCEIDEETLPQGEVGDKYPAIPGLPAGLDLGHQLEPHGEGYTWSIRGVMKDGVAVPGLPGRLALTDDGVLYGEPEPGTEGTYVVTFQLRCRSGTVTKDLVLVIRPLGGQAAGNLIGEEDFQQAIGWTLDSGAAVFGPAMPACPDVNLWHETDEVKYAFDNIAQQNEMGHVAYFGTDDAGRPIWDEDPWYCDQRVKGCLTSPPYHVNNPDWQDEELVVGFKSWRRVENFGGAYDKAWVDVRINDGGWQTVWYKDSDDESLAYWAWQEADRAIATNKPIVLNAGDKIRVRFCFDSVDGHNNGATGEAWGWLVDELRLYAGSSTFRINNCPPQAASVGVSYREEVRASGGPNVDYDWDIINGTLPPGLALEEDGRDFRLIYITGVPRPTQQDRYEFSIRARSPNGQFVDTIDCTMFVNEDVILLDEDFEDDPTWSLGELWHFTDDQGVAGVDQLGPANHAAYFGKDDHGTPDYDTGEKAFGFLTLDRVDALNETISLAAEAVEAVRIRFDYWREVEEFAGGYDRVSVEVKFNNGDWRPTGWFLDSGTASVEDWLEAIIEFKVPVGATTMTLRFVFDSIDKWYNDYVGWLVDNLIVKKISPAGVGDLPTQSELDALRKARSAGTDSLSVMNLPNPVTDVHTTTFMVRSVDVDAMRIEIYDLGGMLVYEEEVPGNELVWHTENDYGEFLANGIYLYRAYVRVDGEWVVTKAQKLVILR